MAGNPTANHVLRLIRSSIRKLVMLLPLRPPAAYVVARRSYAWTTIMLLVCFVVGFAIAITLL